MLDRAGVTLIKVYNEGLSVFLYDEANYESIRKAVPAILFDSNEGPHEDRALKKLAAEGKLVVYELRQDDSLHIEVVVGGPLTKKEMRGAKWHKPQTAPLSLPSGTLFIDSYNSLRLLPEEKPYEKGGTVKVKPGNYVLTRICPYAPFIQSTRTMTAIYARSALPNAGLRLSNSGGTWQSV